jgi:hypothetical protein
LDEGTNDMMGRPERTLFPVVQAALFAGLLAGTAFLPLAAAALELSDFAGKSIQTTYSEIVHLRNGGTIRSLGAVRGIGERVNVPLAKERREEAHRGPVARMFTSRMGDPLGSRGRRSRWSGTRQSPAREIDALRIDFVPSR